MESVTACSEYSLRAGEQEALLPQPGAHCISRVTGRALDLAHHPFSAVHLPYIYSRMPGIQQAKVSNPHDFQEMTQACDQPGQAA